MRLSYMAPINQLGYGIAGLNVLKGLVDTGHNPTLFPIGGVEAPSSLHPMLGAAIKGQDDYDPSAPCVRMYHQFHLAETVGKGMRVGFPIFELDTFTDREKHHMGAMDRLLVCSEYARKVVYANGITTPTFVVPLGVDRTIFNEDVRPTLDQLATYSEYVHSDCTIFLHMGKWEVRKGADIIVTAFNKAFTKEDGVLLLMACENPFIGDKNKEWENLYLTSTLGNKIRCLPRLATHQDVASLMSVADCGLFPARAEGWNLELLEMMSMGKDVICTDYSAHTEFANEGNARLINIDETETAFDGVWFHGQGQWASLGDSQVDQLVEHMRAVHKDGARNNLVGIDTAKRLSWTNSAKSLIVGVS